MHVTLHQDITYNIIIIYITYLYYTYCLLQIEQVKTSLIR